MVGSNIFYQIGWGGSRLVMDLFYRNTIEGIHHVPREGPFIVASNHLSFFDPPLVGSSLPRELYYFARKTLFKPGWRSHVLEQVHTIPVDRDGDGSDISAFKKVFSVLKGGNGLLIFPEGTRSPDGRPGKSQRGVGLIACRAGVPVLPVRVFGTHTVYGRNRTLPDWQGNLTVVIGPILSPESFDPGPSHDDRYPEAARRIMSAITRLSLPPPNV
jgi:1-acyl-sn-glycerol-3-phosphate acyltransferase